MILSKAPVGSSVSYQQKQCGNEIEFRIAPVEPEWISYSGSMGRAWVGEKFRLIMRCIIKTDNLAKLILFRYIFTFSERIV